MRTAVALASRGLGNVWPNPAVGCVLVRDGAVVGRGWTQPGGRPHAETEALARAGSAARGATAYVTLEPCAHHGRTPPCADALIEAGIARAVVAMRDPDPRTDGTGIDRLREAGIDVETGLCSVEAAEVAGGFIQRLTHGRPLVTLKLATTLDGRIATHGGESQWITGPAARAYAHLLRASHDAILVGTGTALADNPELTCRLPGLEGHSPVRVVADGRLRLPLTHALVAGAGTPATWVLTLAGGQAERRDAFAAAGTELIDIAADGDGNLDLAAALAALGGRGITRLLVEGGSRIAASMMRLGLVDRLVWIRAPRIMGGDGVPAMVGFGVDRLEQMPEFELVSVRPAGPDVVEFYKRTE